MKKEFRTANSRQIIRSKKIVQKMTRRMGFDEKIGSVNWKAVRIISGLGYRLMPKDKGAKYKKEKIADINILHITPKKKKNNGVILYIHGGGFVSGSAAESKGYGSMLANYTGSEVYAFDYALSPESKFPCALNDCYNVYKSLIYSGTVKSIALVGESAGGNLCLATTFKIIDSKIPKPLCLVVHSPFTDFSGSVDRHIHKISDLNVKESCLKPLADMYAPGENLKSPYISPVYGSYKDFPPLYITCDHNETLFADSYEVYKKCKGNNVSGKIVIMKNAYHAFATLGTGSPETLKILKESSFFINYYLKRLNNDRSL